MKNLILITVLFMSAFAMGQEADDKSDWNKLAVKITPTQMIMGELNLGVEFKMSRKTSLEIELGPTISEVGLGGRTFKGMKNDADSSNIESEGSIGYFGAIALRYYPLEKSQALHKLYVSPQLKYRVYNTIISEDTGLWDEVTSTNTQYKFLFNVGYQLWASKSFGFDFYLGAGLGYREYTSYSTTTTITSTEITYTWDKDVVRSPQMLLNLGIKVAIGG